MGCASSAPEEAAEEQKPVTVAEDAEKQPDSPVPDPDSVRVLQWNVFEDGLADTPASLGFSIEFQERFSRLLTVLSDDGSGARFMGFAKTRDFSSLPKQIPIDSLSAFFGTLDNVYTMVYHTMGGEAVFQFADSASPPPAFPSLPVGNSLRALFLHSKLSSDGSWSTPTFESEVAQALHVTRTQCKSQVEEMAAAQSQLLHSLRDEAWDGPTGYLTWARRPDGGLSKRREHVFKKWAKTCAVFTDAQTSDEGDALPWFFHAFHGPAEELPATGDAQALVQIELDENGDIGRLRTGTLEASIIFLLHLLCVHAKDNPALPGALAAFGASEVEEDNRAPALHGILSQEMQKWGHAADLATRHGLFCDMVRRAAPHVVTLVEFDDKWRAQPIPTFPEGERKYAAIHGKGTATVMYDERKFADASSLIGGPRGIKTNLPDEVVPKSSCLCVLQPTDKKDESLLVVAAIHLESGKPSQTDKVKKRASALRSLLWDVDQVVGHLAQSRDGPSRPVHVLIGGDFNALREEFIFGNTADFFAVPRLQNIVPKLSTPKESYTPPQPPVASLGIDQPQALYLQLPRLEEGLVAEVTAQDDGLGCTRAGSNMVIDFIFFGSTTKESAPARAVSLVTKSMVVACSDEKDGIRRAVEALGSDHLPVAADVYFGDTCI